MVVALGLAVQLLTSRRVRKQRTHTSGAERGSNPQGLSLMPCPKDFTASQAASPAAETECSNEPGEHIVHSDRVHRSTSCSADAAPHTGLPTLHIGEHWT